MEYVTTISLASCCNVVSVVTITVTELMSNSLHVLFILFFT